MTRHAIKNRLNYMNMEALLLTKTQIKPRYFCMFLYKQEIK